MIRTPTDTTLKKYGLSKWEWQDILANQGGVCGACGKEPSSGRLVTDHQHVKGWKKLPPEKRKTYVRGLLCWTCNHFRLGKGATVKNLFGAYQYLIDYEQRRLLENEVRTTLVGGTL